MSDSYQYQPHEWDIVAALLDAQIKIGVDGLWIDAIEIIADYATLFVKVEYFHREYGIRWREAIMPEFNIADIPLGLEIPYNIVEYEGGQYWFVIEFPLPPKFWTRWTYEIVNVWRKFNKKSSLDSYKVISKEGAKVFQILESERGSSND